jgi:hypothetical protein
VIDVSLNTSEQVQGMHLTKRDGDTVILIEVIKMKTQIDDEKSDQEQFKVTPIEKMKRGYAGKPLAEPSVSLPTDKPAVIKPQRDLEPEDEEEE